MLASVIKIKLQGHESKVLHDGVTVSVIYK